MSYLDYGFNNRLTREFPVASSGERPLLSSEDFDSLVEGISGSKITSGISQSKDGMIKINWDKGVIEIYEGGSKIVEFGKFDDGTRGMRINYAKGNLISSDMIELILGGKTIEGGKANTLRLFIDKGGLGGRNRLMAQFSSGSPRVIATQP